MKQLLTSILLLTCIMAKAQNYDIYVSDAGNFQNPPWQILKFDSAGMNTSVFTTNSLSWPQDILFLNDSVVLVSNLVSGKICRYNANSGNYISDFASSIGGPTRMKIGSDSLIYVLQWSGDGLVRKYNQDGTFAGNFTSVPVPQSIGLDWDASGNLYVSSYNGKYIRKFDPIGTDLGLFVDSNLLGPTNVWFNPQGELIVLDYNGNSVKKFNSLGSYLGTLITNIGNPEGLAILSNGNMLIGSGASHSVKLYNSNGIFIHDIIAPGTANLITPNAITLRMNQAVSVDENNVSKELLVRPTSGSEFYFSDAAQKAFRILLYSIDGKYIQDLSGSVPWKPEPSLSGQYIIKFKFRDKSEFTQRIFIAH